MGEHAGFIWAAYAATGLAVAALLIRGLVGYRVQLRALRRFEGGGDRPSSGGSSRLLMLLPVAVFAGLAALFTARLGSGDPSRVPSALIGKPVPSFDLPPVAGLRDGAGQPLPGLADPALKAGGVTVVNVWASWCGPCRIEHPALMELGRDPAIRVVGINYKDNPENARRFLGALGNPFSAVGTDESGRAAIEWGVYGVPETFVIGPDGRIRYKQVGPLGPDNLPAFTAALRGAASR